MEGKNTIYDKIQELLGDIQGNLTILEQQVDADIQLEYYTFLEDMEFDFDQDDVLRNRDSIFHDQFTIEEKKKLIVQLACINNIQAYRTLEKFLNCPDVDLKDWAILAFQENRLLIESGLMDESQVFIATGLGGKGLKLRYFTVFLSKAAEYSDFEKKIVNSELDYALKTCGGDLENLEFDHELCRINSLIPLSVPLQDIFNKIIAECNLYGNFLKDECIITNVKILDNDQIRKLVRNKLVKTKPGCKDPGLQSHF